MKRIRVYGDVKICVSTVIEVDDDANIDDIIEKAYAEFGGIHSYAGNGGMDKLIGVTGDDTIEASYSEVDFAPNREDDIQDA
jgi:hypothetical protein